MARTITQPTPNQNRFDSGVIHRRSRETFAKSPMT
jgi:hypothetical protein